MRLGEIATRLSCALEGDPDLEITDVAGIQEAEPGELTFLANRRYAPGSATPPCTPPSGADCSIGRQSSSPAT